MLPFVEFGETEVGGCRGLSEPQALQGGHRKEWPAETVLKAGDPAGAEGRGGGPVSTLPSPQGYPSSLGIGEGLGYKW